jgi:putative hydrolase of the HAD superfamily
MTAVRLAAPDLAGHLTFNSEQAWTGPTARSLTEAIGYLDDGTAAA